MRTMKIILWDLKKHMNAGDHKCDLCDIFASGNLKKHINAVHKGQKGHKCDSCGKAISSAQYLKIHINSVHNGQKDHKCESCGKAFSEAGSLKKHINAVHNT